MTTRLRRPPLLLLLLLLVGSVPAASAPPTRLADIRAGMDDSLISGRSHVVIGGTVYFAGESRGTGLEPWMSDGTPEGTVRIADLRLGNAGSNPGGFTALGDSVLFLAFDERGLGLWKTHGTEAGTVRLRASTRVIFPTARNMARVGQSVLFGAELDDSGEELWKSDGTPEGTVRVMDLRPGDLGSRPTRLTPVGDLLFFTATDGTSSRAALWSSNGTEAGTVKLLELPVGAAFDFLTPSGSTLLIGIRRGAASELWKSDGTPGGTTRVAELNTLGFNAHAFLDGQLVFSHPEGLGKSDGTPAGTSSWSAPRGLSNLVAWNGAVYFIGFGPGQNLELWRSNGTPTGHSVVATLAPNETGFVMAANIAVMNGRLYLSWSREESAEFWTSDGTAGGTSRVRALSSAGSEFQFLEPRATTQRLYFRVSRQDDNVPSVSTLWVSDGTEAGTGPLRRRATPASILMHTVRAVGNALHFFVDDDTHGPELWRSDGTAAGTRLVRDIRPGLPGSVTPNFAHASAVMNGVQYFAVDDGTHGMELWKSDGTAAGTVLVKDIRPGAEPSLERFRDMAVMNGALYFIADDGEHGTELWRSDGTEEGTTLVGDLVPGPEGSHLFALTPVGNTLFFVSSDSEHGTELWKSDGTAAGTTLVKDILPGSQGALDFTLDFVSGPGGVLYFVADDGEHGPQPWRSDGTPEGTYLLAEVQPGSTEPDFELTMTAVGDTLYLAARDSAHGRELWKSDGTREGTVLVKDIEPGPRGSEPILESLTRMGSHVYFFAHSSAHGFELWKTDGTSDGTVRVTDLRPGPASGVLPYGWLLAVEEQGLLFFQGVDEARGVEMWMTDGTPEGTSLLADLAPGAASSNPGHLHRLGNQVFVVADDGSHGIEPWAIPFPDRTAPTLTCPASIEAQASEASGAEVSYPAATASDDQGTATVEYSHPSGSRFPVGTTQVTVTAVDTSGNRQQCTFEVRITAPPVAAPPGDTPADTSEGCGCGAGSGTTGMGMLWALLMLVVASGRRHGHG